MWFWWLMTVCDLSIPLLLIVSGRIMWKHPPKKINWGIGYRTERSMKNMETWKFAHLHCGRSWWKIGWLLLVFSAGIHLLLYHAPQERIGVVGGILCTVQCVILLLPVFMTERALKKHFTDDGIPRS